MKTIREIIEQNLGRLKGAASAATTRDDLLMTSASIAALQTVLDEAEALGREAAARDAAEREEPRLASAMRAAVALMPEVRPAATTPAQMQAVLADYLSGLQVAEIARRQQIAVVKVSEMLATARRKGLLAQHGERPVVDRSAVAERREKVLNAWAAGQSQGRIAKTLGVKGYLVNNDLAWGQAKKDPRAAPRYVAQAARKQAEAQPEQGPERALMEAIGVDPDAPEPAAQPAPQPPPPAPIGPHAEIRQMRDQVLDLHFAGNAASRIASMTGRPLNWIYQTITDARNTNDPRAYPKTPQQNAMALHRAAAGAERHN